MSYFRIALQSYMLSRVKDTTLVSNHQKYRTCNIFVRECSICCMRCFLEFAFYSVIYGAMLK